MGSARRKHGRRSESGFCSDKSMDLSELRLSYTKAGLSESEADPDPLRQFEMWMDQAMLSDLVEPNAMTLATWIHPVNPMREPFC